jgi:ribosomal protein S18 acetylase RimI-like enzyme
MHEDVMQIHIRRATPEDAASLAAVEVTSWRTAYRGLMPDALLDGLSEAEPTEGWHQNLLKHGTSGRKRVLLAVSDAGVRGFVRIGAEQEAHQIGLVYLLYVWPEVWRRGVGTALMHAAMDSFRDLGVSEVVLWVLRDNQRARTFYEGLGWTPDGQTTIADYGGIELEALCYRRVLAKDEY